MYLFVLMDMSLQLYSRALSKKKNDKCSWMQLTWAVSTGEVDLDFLPLTVLPVIGRGWVVTFPHKDLVTASSTRL